MNKWIYKYLKIFIDILYYTGTPCARKVFRLSLSSFLIRTGRAFLEQPGMDGSILILEKKSSGSPPGHW